MPGHGINEEIGDWQVTIPPDGKAQLIKETVPVKIKKQAAAPESPNNNPQKVGGKK